MGGCNRPLIFQAGTAPVLGGAEPESILGRGNGARQPGRAFLSLRAWLTVHRISRDSVPDVGRVHAFLTHGGHRPGVREAQRRSHGPAMVGPSEAGGEPRPARSPAALPSGQTRAAFLPTVLLANPPEL